MKLVGVAMVRNEADIVEAFVRHNLRVLDHLVVIDHGSDDATGRILLRLREEGLALTLGLDRSVAFEQGRVVSTAMRAALASNDADFGFAFDADEFIVAESRVALEQSLARLGDDDVGAIRWSLYVPSPDAAAHDHPFARLRHRVVDERVTMRKVVVPRTFATRPDRWIDAGNHWVFDAGPGRQSIVAALDIDARLAHLPFRSVAQTAQKVVLGYFAQRLAFGGGEATAHIGWHWRHVYDRILERGLEPADLALLAKQSYLGGRPFEHAAELSAPDCVEDPLPIRDDLRYTDAASVDPLARLAQWIERLLDSSAR
ncbi:MAG TPA: glycosyltransferase family 2 protein [Candidatus Saccharimonadia bacterium]|nr:glycosyltransferase family 2 protein [Candidatus Saccharimonadia bacterium]